MEVSLPLFLTAVLAMIAAVTMTLVRQILVIMRRNQLVKLGETNRDLQREQESLTEAWRTAQERARILEGERKVALVQITELQKQVKQAQEENFQLIHELGEPGEPGRRLFTASLNFAGSVTIGQTSTKDLKLRGLRHNLEVWAENAEAALKLIRATYPQEGGFITSRPLPAQPYVPPVFVPPPAETAENPAPTAP